MARVTVEDCLKNVENRFKLVLLAAKRARQIERTSTDVFVDIENDKPTVLALREIAENKISYELIDKIDKAQRGEEVEQVEVEQVEVEQVEIEVKSEYAGNVEN